jgi:hypothetical protein
MTRHQSLTAVAGKIIHTTMHLCPTIVVYVVQYTVEWCFFLYESCVKCVSSRKCQRKCHRKFPRFRVLSTTVVHKFIKKAGSSRSFLNKKPYFVLIHPIDLVKHF